LESNDDISDKYKDKLKESLNFQDLNNNEDSKDETKILNQISDPIDLKDVIKTLNEIQKVLNDDEYYLEKINQPIFADNSIEQIMDKIVKQIRTVMNIQSI